MSESIKDRVAVMGVGCTKFGELWEKDAEDLLVDAVYAAYEDAGVTQDDIEAAWVGIMYPFTGMAGVSLADPLKLYGKPNTRVENFCASGMDAFRNACFSIAAGVYDIVLVCGVEKILDQGSRGLPDLGSSQPVMGDISAPAMFALAATRCFSEYGWNKETLAHVPVKNHHNGAKHPKAHFRKEITKDDVLNAPMIAAPLGRYDCCAVSDGAAALVLSRPDLAKKFNHKDDYVLVKANALAVHTGAPMYKPSFNYIGFPATQDAAKSAYEQAGISNPRKEISFAEVHDCFSITEILNCEDLQFCRKAEGGDFVASGATAVDGELPVNPSGGLKCFGHPIGATGCRMLYEVTKQLQGRADGYQVKNRELGLAHNLGGPGSVCSVTILGQH